MIVKPNQKWTAAESIALAANRVQIDQVEPDKVLVTIQRPDGGSTTVLLSGSQGCSVITRIVGHTEDHLPAEQRPGVCPDCDGAGETIRPPRGAAFECGRCRGKGTLPAEQRPGVCPDCDGAGETIRPPRGAAFECGRCRGKGTLPAEQRSEGGTDAT